MGEREDRITIFVTVHGDPDESDASLEDGALPWMCTGRPYQAAIVQERWPGAAVRGGRDFKIYSICRECFERCGGRQAEGG